MTIRNQNSSDTIHKVINHNEVYVYTAITLLTTVSCYNENEARLALLGVVNIVL